MNREQEITYWPPPARRAKPAWSNKISDDNLRMLIDELYVALNAGLLVVSTIAARTLFDRASFLLINDPPGGFGGKLQALVDTGRISASDRSILEAMTDAGSASAHRGFAPTFDQLTAIVDILENYIERTFVLNAVADTLKNATPGRTRKGSPSQNWSWFRAVPFRR
jgi:hypothetical protein